MSKFKKAQRSKSRLRMAIDGGPGSGKSFTALRLAFCRPGVKVAAIEAGENGGLNLYQGLAPDGIPFEFDIHEIKGEYSPTSYTSAIQDAGREGYDFLIIDSLSHAWSGSGGALDQVGDSKFTDKDGWRKVTPMHNRMIESILQSPCHVIVTMRTKIEYVLELDERGKSVPRKVGMAPIQRQGMEYEFTCYGSMDDSHTLRVTKSRVQPIQDAIVTKPGRDFMLPILEWLDTGTELVLPDLPRAISDEQIKSINAKLAKMKVDAAGLAQALSQYGVSAVSQLLASQAQEIEAKLDARIAALAAAEANKKSPVTQ